MLHHTAGKICRSRDYLSYGMHRSNHPAGQLVATELLTLLTTHCTLQSSNDRS